MIQLARRRGVRALLIAAERLDAQIVEARAALGGAPAALHPLQRVRRRVDRSAARGARDLVPPYVWQTQTEFRRCPAAAGYTGRHALAGVGEARGAGPTMTEEFRFTF